MSKPTAPALSGGIDHVHVYAPSREEASAWYEQVLGFERVEALEVWAQDPSGPLTIQDRGGRIHLALFSRAAAKPVSLAFGATAAEYVAWRAHFEAHGLPMRERDHDKSWSLYVTDPFGNELEITTYDRPVQASNSSRA